MVFQRLAKPSRVKPLVGSNPTLSASWEVSGGVTEWLKVAVLKTVVLNSTVSSNLTPTAKY